MEKRNNSVLIGDNTLNFGVACETQLRRSGLDVMVVEKAMFKVFDLVKIVKPDIIVLDQFFHDGDVSTLIDCVRELENYQPKIVVVECFQNNSNSNINQDKIDLYFNHPVDIGNVCEKIIQFSSTASNQHTQIPALNMPRAVDLNESEDDLEIIVTNVILEIGIPAHVKGYHYIRFAIINCIETPNMLNSVTKILYPTVAKEFDTSPSRVERAIRHAIEIAWDRGNIDTLNSYFGYTINNQRGKPTNSEFIAMVSDKLRLKFKHVLAKKSAN